MVYDFVMNLSITLGPMSLNQGWEDLTFAEEDIEINDVCKMIPSMMTRKTKNLLTCSGRVYISYSEEAHQTGLLTTKP